MHQVAQVQQALPPSQGIPDHKEGLPTLQWLLWILAGRTAVQCWLHFRSCNVIGAQAMQHLELAVLTPLCE